MVLIIVSMTLIFQIFLKVAEESGVDAETSGNPPGGSTGSGLCLLQAVLAHQGCAFPFELFYSFLSFSV